MGSTNWTYWDIKKRKDVRLGGGRCIAGRSGEVAGGNQEYTRSSFISKNMKDIFRKSDISGF